MGEGGIVEGGLMVHTNVVNITTDVQLFKCHLLLGGGGGGGGGRERERERDKGLG